MTSDDLRRRLARLNRGGLRNVPDPKAARTDAVDYGDGVREMARAGLSTSTVEMGRPVTLDDVVDGTEIHNTAGRFVMIQRPFRELADAGDELQARYVRSIASFPSDPVQAGVDGNFHALEDLAPDDILFVDIEATGLTARTPLFLLGVLLCEDGRLNACQLFARDESEEPALLAHFSGMLAHARLVVSFNGKSYDLPYIRNRMMFHGLPCRFPRYHIDMLHEARRGWRGRFADYRLQTLERWVCRRTRTGDIPGAEIPGVYRMFMRTGNAVRIGQILRHNALDLITLAELMVTMLEGREP